MSSRSKKAPPAAIVKLLKEITAWRRQRPKPRNIPESFWSAATRLGREYGVSPVSRHLSLDYHGLKRRVLAGEETAISKSDGFVELRCEDIPLERAAGGGFVSELEIYKPGGVMVRVRQSGPSGVDMGDIVESCLRRG